MPAPKRDLNQIGPITGSPIPLHVWRLDDNIEIVLDINKNLRQENKGRGLHKTELDGVLMRPILNSVFADSDSDTTQVA